MLLCILILNWKKRLIILDQVCKACLHVSRLMSFNAFSSCIFISSLIIEKEHLAFFCCMKQEEKPSCVLSVDAPGITQLLTGLLLLSL